MTEAEWLACAKPEPIVEFVRGTASERKLRLFACACCRHVWRLLRDKRSRSAVEVAERYADGLERKASLAAARAEARQADAAERLQLTSRCGAGYLAWSAARENIQAAIGGFADATAWNASYRKSGGLLTASGGDVEREQTMLASLLRDLFGNPFRPLVADPRWLTPNVVDLARTIYEERAFDRLPILADALLDAGCDSADILDHCRSEGPHVRGCWVVDLILGKS